MINRSRDFPGGPVVKTQDSINTDVGLIPGLGIKTPHAALSENNNTDLIPVVPF